MNQNIKPIDRAKPSNRRCINCIHWDKALALPSGLYHQIAREKVCKEAGNKEINYWNCCKHFQWNPSKEYTVPLGK